MSAVALNNGGFARPQGRVMGAGYVDYGNHRYKLATASTDWVVEQLAPTMDELQEHMSQGSIVNIHFDYLTQNGTVDIRVMLGQDSAYVSLLAKSFDHVKGHAIQILLVPKEVKGESGKVIATNVTRRIVETMTRQNRTSEHSDGIELQDAQKFQWQRIPDTTQAGPEEARQFNYETLSGVSLVTPTVPPPPQGGGPATATIARMPLEQKGERASTTSNTTLAQQWSSIERKDGRGGRSGRDDGGGARLTGKTGDSDL